MRLIGISVLLCLFSQALSLYAVIARPGKIAVLSSEGQPVMITLHGDENCKYATTEDGYTLLKKGDTWFYAIESRNGDVVCSERSLIDHSRMSGEQAEFVGSLKKGLVPFKKDNATRMPAAAFAGSGLKKPVTGDRHVLVILMAFSDLNFVKTHEDFNRLFNETGYKEDGANGSVSDYYRKVSYGKLNLKADVIGPFKASNPMSYYGGNYGDGGHDQNPYALFLEAIDYAKSAVSLKDYDSDGDGYIDNVHIIFAGYGEEAGASSNSIWSHRMTFNDILVDGVLVNGYSCSPELREKSGNGISRIGPPCHEIGHALGAMDYYDTNYADEGQYPGTGTWDIMASGSWNDGGISPATFNPYVKIYDFGWTTARNLEEEQMVSLGSALSENEICKIETGVYGDFYLLENHNGESYMRHEPGEGLLIFHIGPDLQSKAASNKINSTYPQQCYPVCAASEYRSPANASSTYGNINSRGCTFPGSSGKTAFSAGTVPATVTFDGADVDFALSDIKYDSGIVTFKFSGTNVVAPDEPDNPHYDDIVWYEDFENGMFLRSWKLTDETNDSETDLVSVMTSADTPEYPAPASGKCYFYIKSKAMALGGHGKTVFLMESEKVNLSEGETYTLSFKVREYNNADNADNAVSVTDNLANEQRHFVSSLNQWEECTFQIENAPQTFLFTLRLEVNEGTCLFVDDIRVAKNSTTKARIPFSSYSSYSSYDIKGRKINYSLSGVRHSRQQRGINIIRLQNGVTIKAIAR